jgi:hypothetical protein
MPDGWELANGTNPAVNDAAADPDHDGLSNLQEYWAGTSPTNAASVLQMDVIERSSPTNIVLQFSALSNRIYRVEYRDGWETPGWSVLTTIPAVATNRSVIWPDLLAPVGARYYRLTVPVAP